MKKLILVFAMMFSVMSFAQVEQGRTFVGVSSNSVTGINFSTERDSGVRNYQFGVQGGHFFANRLALVAGAGYQSTRIKDVGTVDEAISYQAGLKYYVESILPVQIDYNGIDKANYFGTQVGYAYFPSRNFSIEPNLRYDFGLKDDLKDRFSFGVGFNYLF